MPASPCVCRGFVHSPRCPHAFGPRHPRYPPPSPSLLGSVSTPPYLAFRGSRCTLLRVCLVLVCWFLVPLVCQAWFVAVLGAVG